MTELALKLIAENKRSKAPYLDLGKCGLEVLPKELAELVWLEVLNLGHEWHDWGSNGYQHTGSKNRGEANKALRDISLLANLPLLRVVALNDTAVTDLAPLAGLRQLRNINAWGCPLPDLVAVAGIQTLQVLLCTSKLIQDLAPLSGLSALQHLYLNSTQVRDLSPLSGLFALQELSLNSTQVRDLSPLSGLLALQELDLNSTQVSDLSPLRGMIERGREVSVKGYVAGITVVNCPLTIPPLEIAAQGNEAILSYFREREAGDIDHLYEAKMLILGEGGAGKTSLLRRLYQPNCPLPLEQESTKGIDIYRHNFPLPNGRTFRLNVWDFGGQEIYHATHQFFLTRRSLYLLLDDTRKDHKSVSDPGFKDWLDLIELFGDNSPTLIFQNEKAGRSKAIGMDGIQARYPMVQDCFKGNLESPQAADSLREKIAACAAALSHIGDELPAKWIKIRAAIEARAQQVPHISQQAYFDLYSQHLPFDRTKALHLSRYFHDLGVFLHFQDDPLLARTVILQNTWATQAVYRVLDDEAVKQRHGHFTQQDCTRLWQDSGYADMQPELLALMQRFELCYLLPDGQIPTWFAPQLLAPNKPTALVGWPQQGDLVVRFRYGFMPKGIISRLMVRQHRLTGVTTDACLTCVLFHHNTSSATAELLPDGNEIELRARGPERKVLLNVLANEIEAINQGFPGLHEKVTKLIPCLCNTCQNAVKPFMYEERNLVRRLEKNRYEVECECSLDMVAVRTLLDGVDAGAAAAQPDWAKHSKPPAPRTIRIFLASSNELLPDRDAFELHFRRENDRYHATGQYLEIVRWENFLDSVSQTRKQDDYNQAIRDCDIFVSLFATKAGQYTQEEFDTAYAQFKTSGTPMIFTFFKDVPTSTASIRREDMESLWAMRKKLDDLGHFYTAYQTPPDLHQRFSHQLQKMTDQGKLQ
jgi:Leucine-rich repeat (LRR) protein